MMELSASWPFHLSRPLPLAAVALAVLAALLTFTGCGTTHRLPPYEPPIARAEFQTVRTTAYTHTESDHLAYGNRNALGGTLRSASIPDVAIAPAAAAVAPPFPMRLPGDDLEDAQRYGFQGRPVIRPRANVPIQSASPNHAAGSVAYPAPFGSSEVYPPPSAIPPRPVIYGSAAADWSRWPAGTIFRLESTGEIYRVDDYGWALAGRNTIDLYKSSAASMDAWGVRRVGIHVLQWGNREESLRRLRSHQGYKHIRRMVLELEGKTRAARQLE